MRYFLVIGWALFIDGLQAGISFALAGFMGTIGGATGAALVAQRYCPEVVQGACTTIATAGGAIVGTFANPVLVPVGVVIGFVINMCLSLTMGAGLILALVHLCGWKSVQKYLMPGFIGDMIPGINNLPFWTYLAVSSSLAHAREEREREGKGAGFFGSLAFAMGPAGARGIMQMKEGTMKLPNVKETLAKTPWTQQQLRQPKKSEDVATTSAQENERRRTEMRDIRPKTA